MADKARASLSSGEVAELTEKLARTLDAMIIETQPEVAARLLEMVSDPDAGLSDFAGVIRSDQTLSGRLLRMANSAYFAQRDQVTTLERAAVLLGINRIRAVALGFYMSRSVDAGGDSAYSRLAWGKSLLRACVAAKLTELLKPNLYAEAFLTGLMMDAGVPLARAIIGPEAYDRVCAPDHPPSRAFKAEHQSLAFTHVDVMRALVRRWRVPELLAKPILWHHTPPQDLANTAPLHVLHRVAYYVGSMHLEHSPPRSVAVPLPSLGQRVLGVQPRQLASAFGSACAEYAALREFFGHVAQGIGDVEELGLRVQTALLKVVDKSMEDQLRRESMLKPAVFRFASGQVEVAREGDRGEFAVAYLLDEQGARQAMHRFLVDSVNAKNLLHELSIEARQGDGGELESMDDYLRALAA